MSSQSSSKKCVARMHRGRMMRNARKRFRNSAMMRQSRQQRTQRRKKGRGKFHKERMMALSKVNRDSGDMAIDKNNSMAEETSLDRILLSRGNQHADLLSLDLLRLVHAPVTTTNSSCHALQISQVGCLTWWVLQEGTSPVLLPDSGTVLHRGHQASLQGFLQCSRIHKPQSLPQAIIHRS